MNEQQALLAAQMLQNLAQRIIFLESVTSFLMWTVLFILIIGGYAIFKNWIINIIKSVTGK